MITNTGGKLSLIALIRRAPKHLLALALALALTPATALAQTPQSAFSGTWQIQTPEQGTLILLLRNQGIASYFWGDNADRNIYPGSWTHAETLATVVWGDGSSHLIEKTNSGLNATYRSASGDRRYSAPAKQLPQEMLGQWAKPPTRADDLRSDRDEAKGFFGTWKIGDSEQFIFVESDRATASNIGGDSGQRGQWAKQGSELHIIWESGQYGILRETERGFDYKRVKAGQVIEDDESKTVVATRTIEGNVPSAWLNNYKAERKADSDGLAFSSRKVARIFYRGDWLVRRGERSFERIELARFGGLKTSRDRSLDGQWTMSGQDVFMRWDDGMRQVLSPVGRSFILYAYRPGRPLDGVPTRIYAAAPKETAKLAEHLEGRKGVAKQIREMAEAAGIDPAAQQDIGWGRTFARWAWPFSDDSDGMTTDEMLAEEYEPEEASDPWWWPFWSEQSAEEADEAENTSENAVQVELETAEDTTRPESARDASVPIKMSAIETDESAQGAAPTTTAEKGQKKDATSAPPAPQRRTTKNWVWPF